MTLSIENVLDGSVDTAESLNLLNEANNILKTTTLATEAVSHSTATAPATLISTSSVGTCYPAAVEPTEHISQQETETGRSST